MKWLRYATRRLVRCFTCGELVHDTPHCGRCGAKLKGVS